MNSLTFLPAVLSDQPYMRDYSHSGQSNYLYETQLVNTTKSTINMEFLNVILMYPDLEIHKWIFTLLILLCVVIKDEQY